MVTVPSGANLVAATVTITSGQSLSPAVDLGGQGILRIIMPSAWTAANLTFQTSPDGVVTPADLYDDTGTEVTVVAAASRSIVVDLQKFGALNFIKVRSGTSGSPVTQGADRALTLVTRTLA